MVSFSEFNEHVIRVIDLHLKIKMVLFYPRTIDPDLTLSLFFLLVKTLPKSLFNIYLFDEVYFKFVHMNYIDHVLTLIFEYVIETIARHSQRLAILFYELSEVYTVHEKSFFGINVVFAFC